MFLTVEHIGARKHLTIKRLEPNNSVSTIGPPPKLANVPSYATDSRFWDTTFDKQLWPSSIPKRKNRGALVPPNLARSYPCDTSGGVTRKDAACGVCMRLPVPCPVGVNHHLFHSCYLDCYHILSEIILDFVHGSLVHESQEGKPPPTVCYTQMLFFDLPQSNRQRKELGLSKRQLKQRKIKHRKLKKGNRTQCRKEYLYYSCELNLPSGEGVMRRWIPPPHFPMHLPDKSNRISGGRRWFRSKDYALVFTALALITDKQKPYSQHPLAMKIWEVPPLVGVDDDDGDYDDHNDRPYNGFKVWRMKGRNAAPFLVVLRYPSGSKAACLCQADGSMAGNVLPLLEVPARLQPGGTWLYPKISAHEDGSLSEGAKVWLATGHGCLEGVDARKLAKEAYYPLLDYAVRNQLITKHPWRTIFKHRNQDNRQNFYPAAQVVESSFLTTQKSRLEKLMNSPFERLWDETKRTALQNYVEGRTHGKIPRELIALMPELKQ